MFPCVSVRITLPGGIAPRDIDGRDLRGAAREIQMVVAPRWPGTRRALTPAGLSN